MSEIEKQPVRFLPIEPVQKKSDLDFFLSENLADFKIEKSEIPKLPVLPIEHFHMIDELLE